MKRIFFLALLTLPGITGICQYKEYEVASAPAPKRGETTKTVVRVNLFGAMAGLALDAMSNSNSEGLPNLSKAGRSSFTAEVERVINKRFSVQVAIGYRDLDLTPISVDTLIANHVFFYQKGFTIVPQVKYYWTNFSKKMHNPMGGYIAPFLRIGQYQFELDDNLLGGTYDLKYELTAMGGGFVLGFQLIAGKHFAIDAFLGPQIKHKKMTNVRWRHPSSADDGVVIIQESMFSFEPRAGLTVGFAF